MFDLPRKVKEFSCMCCGERFWTVEGNVNLFNNETAARQVVRKQVALEFSAAHPN